MLCGIQFHQQQAIFFYIGGSPKATINNVGIEITGTLTTTSTIREGGTLLTYKYLKLDGTNTMTGGLKFNNLVQNKVISLWDVAQSRSINNSIK